MPEELEGKILSILQTSPEGVVLQSDIWKSLKSGSREVSRSLAKMEKRALIRREPFSEGGRKTYKVTLLKRVPKIDLSDVIWCACFTCSDLTRCGIGQPISPEACSKLSMSIRNEFLKLERAELRKAATAGKDKNAK